MNITLSSILICFYTLLCQLIFFLLLFSIGPDSLAVCPLSQQ